ncbi:MAG: chromosome segregation protein SMC, partial [Candidatus Woesearchaeota archaeon]
YSSAAIVLLEKFGMSLKGTGGKTITNLFLSHSSDEELAELLNGLYCGDGYVSGSSIELTTKSGALASSVETILTRLGITFASKWEVKAIASSGFSGVYKTIRIYGAYNAEIFSSKIKLVHKMKQSRALAIAAKTVNPNTDLIDANSLIKKTASDLGLNVKKLKKNFPRLDAYCYNQCLPSVYGVQHLITELFSKSPGRSKALSELKKLATSDIFWDEITSIERVQPKDEWVYDLCVEKDHNFIANNIFVHNSNVLDALCFVLGRISSKSLRAERLSHLIYNGGKTKKPAAKAEVSIFFDNSKKTFPVEGPYLKITRTIKASGQSVYRINDVARTRQQVLDIMAMGRVDPEGHNIILQGDIIRFVEMSTEERRQLIDEVSGISVYEDKKQKALSELERVDARLREADILLTERKAHLRELKKDRDQALKYKDILDRAKQTKATYLHIQIKKKEIRKDEIEKQLAEQQNEITKSKEEIERLKKLAEDKKNESAALAAEIEKKGEVEQVELNKELETLRVKIGTDSNRVEMVGKELVKIVERRTQLNSEVQDIEGRIKNLQSQKGRLISEKASISSELKKIEQSILDIRKEESLDEVAELEKQIDSIEKELEAQQAQAQKSAEEKQNLLREKDRIEIQLKNLDDQIAKVKEIEKERSSEISALKEKQARFKKIVVELNKLLNDNSSLAAQVSQIKQQIFIVEEQISKARGRQFAFQEKSIGSSAIKAILEQKEITGIEGRVSNLLTVPAKYSAAIEAAAGSRLNSIVVRDDAVAAECIKYLKAKKLGTATFLPLNKIKGTDESTGKAEGNGVHGSAINLVSFEPKYKSVFSYVFGKTVVVETIDVARRLGIGKFRMVTLDGDIAELSGAMHGGYRKKSESPFQEKNVAEELGKLEARQAEVTAELANLQSSRTANEKQIEAMRAEKAELEGDMIKTERSLHLEAGDLDATKRQEEIWKKELKDIDARLEAAQSSLSEKNRKYAELKSKREQLRNKLSEMRNPAVLAELNAFNQKRQELLQQVMQKDSDIKGLDVQADQILSQEKERIGSILKGLVREEAQFEKEKAELEKGVEKQKKDLKISEEKSKKFHAKYRELFDNRTKLSDEIRVVEEKIIRKEEQLNLIEVRINNISVKKAEMIGELTGLNEEFQPYSDLKLLEETDEERLKQETSRHERAMIEMGNVNMKALEVYDEIEKQYSSLLDKREKLDKEKLDVVTMMNEVEAKKKDLFMNTFNVLNENFKRIFSQLSVKGEAYLALENEESPFEGGLKVRVRIISDKFLDIRSLSGGEKTLTALAFIFGIQEYEPSSFYVLDEVDAALDKRNSEKLAKLIEAYSSRAQYIVISHNDAIISEATTLYGVSMDEHGVSNVVSLKI